MAAFPRLHLWMRDLAGALFRPDVGFSAGSVPRVPGALLALLLFVTWVAGDRLVQGAFQNAQAKTLAVLDVDARMRGLLQNAPTQVQNEVRGRMLDSILGKQSGIMTSAGIAASGVLFLLVLAELWLVSAVAVQFFGGQEDRRGTARPSGKLLLVAFVPLALRHLAAGIVMTLRSSDAAANALTLEDYRRASGVRFDVLSLLPFGGAGGFLPSAGRLLTDPFVLWALAILCLGGREVFRIRTRGALGLCGVLVAVLSLQAALFSAIGFTWEL